MPSKEQIIEVDVLPEKIELGATYSINQANPNSYTHGMFKYPCKFIPEIPRWAISTYLHNIPGSVLDPFAGSGTSILEAVIGGHNAYSAEIDDIAKLITKVKVTKLKDDEYEDLDKYYELIIRNMSHSQIMADIPEINNLYHWFTEETVSELARIRHTILSISNENIRDFFSVCFVSIIKKVSFADDTSPKPYVSNKIIKVPPKVEKEFSSVYARYKKMEQELMQVEHIGRSEVLSGDALTFNTRKKVDIAITSPPYINAFDYGRTMRLENIWMGTLSESELRSKKKEYIGTEAICMDKAKKDFSILERSTLLHDSYVKIAEVDLKRALIVKQFFGDMEKNLIRVNSCLKRDGKYMIVIGNSSIRNTEVESWRILEQLAHNIGYRTETYYNYEIKNPYIRIPRQGQGGKISRDYILVLGKGR